ncbi:carbohydrate kinase family protein [Phaeobacter sp. JH20_02]|uniref:carbohydrate kinase family protein n=1 Tax=unclassified Phaeobacter TaxID=2621772 RepID=UPI003A89FA07
MTTREGIICAGNWIVDLVHEIAHWPAESDLVRIDGQDKGVGGGAANVVTALTKLETGLPLWPMGAIGQDDFGKFIKAHCHELGLPTHLITEKPDTATAHTHVMSVTGRSRTFFYQGGSNDVLSDQDFPTGVFESHKARIFYLGYLTLLADLDRITDDGSTPAARVLSRARAAGMTTCVDLASVDRPDFSKIVATTIRQIDYLILNEIELARASGQTPPVASQTPNMQDMIEMAKALIKDGVRRAVVVHCQQMALWIGVDGQVAHVPVVPLPRELVASPLGAGDAFCAGILYALHEGWTPQRALELGHAIARASLRGVTATEAIPNLNQLTDQLDRQTKGITT